MSSNRRSVWVSVASFMEMVLLPSSDGMMLLTCPLMATSSRRSPSLNRRYCRGSFFWRRRLGRSRGLPLPTHALRRRPPEHLRVPFRTICSRCLDLAGSFAPSSACSDESRSHSYFGAAETFRVWAALPEHSVKCLKGIIPSLGRWCFKEIHEWGSVGCENRTCPQVQLYRRICYSACAVMWNDLKAGAHRLPVGTCWHACG